MHSSSKNHPLSSPSENLAEKKRPKWKRLLLILGGCFVLLVAMAIYSLFGPDPPIRISKETTYITEPIGADGMVDYFAAIRQTQKEGVTPENNAAVLLWQAIGPWMIDLKDRPAFFKELGIPVLPEKGEYLTRISEGEDAKLGAEWLQSILPKKEGAEDLDVLDEEFAEPEVDYEDIVYKAQACPWKSVQIPPLAEWLKKNEKPIDLIFEASLRPKLDPIFLRPPKNESLLGILLPTISICPEAQNALMIRAMNHIAENRIDAAISDAIACHRLARLVAQGVTLVEQTTAVHMDEDAFNLEMAILETHPNLKQLQTMRNHLATLKPCMNVSRSLDRWERLMMLSLFAHLKRHGTIEFDDVFDGNSNVLLFGLRATTDWNIPLEMANDWCKKMLSAVNEKSSEDRQAAIQEIVEQLEGLNDEIKEEQSSFQNRLNRTFRSELIGKIYCAQLLSSFSYATETSNRVNTQLALARTAIEIEIYYAKHREYPKLLVDLDMENVKTVPKDIYTEKPFLYERRGKGFLLYSIGQNLVDDNGTAEANDILKGEYVEENLSFGEYSDIVIRLPLPPLKLPSKN